MKMLLSIACNFLVALAFAGMLTVLNARCGNTSTVAMVNGIAISGTNDASSIIVKTLLDQFDKDENIVVTPQEIEKQRGFYVRLAKRFYDQRIAYLNRELGELVASGGGTADISNRVNRIKEEIVRLKPDFFVPADDMLKADVLLWKRNNALYRRYGGNVHFSHVGGAFPADAYEAFFKRKEAERAFKIFNEELQNQFWDGRTNYTQKSDLLLDDGKKTIETPPWEKVIEE